MRVLLLLLLFTGMAFCATCSLASPVSAPLPLDSWVYPTLDKLAGAGLLESSLQGTRPYTRLEAARLFLEAKRHVHTRLSPRVVFELLERLETELHDQVIELSHQDGITPPSYLKPMQSAEVHYVFREGEASDISGTDARQFSLNYNNQGINYAENHNGEMIFDGVGRLADSLQIYWRPQVLTGEGNDGADIRLLQGTVALGLGPIEISAGRQSLWWGQGRHGSLVLTNNAAPLDMLRITNPQPLLLPWLFEYLGPFRFDVFWSRLEKERTIPKPWFAGLRINFKPLPNLEIGASRTAIFGGEGRPDINFSDFLTILGGKNLSGGEDTSNQLAAFDLSLRLPFLRGAQLYGEWGGEDEAGGFVSNHAYIAGLYLPHLEPSGRASLRLEYADLSHIAHNAPAWYRHGIYKSGYTYQQMILGHHVGGAAKDFFAELQLELPADLMVKLNFDHETRGYDQPVFEEHVETGVGFIWYWSETSSLELRYRLDQVSNFGFAADYDQKLHIASAGLNFNW